jgi:solute carrier family 25 folate transporter 32
MCLLFLFSETELGLNDILVASIASKLVASSITYPHELLRSRFQRQRVKRYHSIGDALVKIFREEGPGAFYRGMGTNLIRVIPTCAITFTVYEYALKLINGIDP